MNRLEKIAEYPITEWEGVTVKIIIQHPKLLHTITSQMILDYKMMEDIYYINPPKDFKLMRTKQKIFEYHIWKEKNKRAHDLIRYMSSNIANSILRTLEKELNNG